MHRLHDLVDWSDSCATSNETDLRLLPDLAEKREVTISKVGDLAEWGTELDFVTDRH